MHNKRNIRLKQVIIFFKYIINNVPVINIAFLLSIILMILEYATLSITVVIANLSQSNKNIGAIESVGNYIAKYLDIESGISSLVLLFLILLTLRTFLGYIYIVLVSYISKYIHRELAVKVFDQVLFNEPMSNIYKRSIGHYITLAGDDTFKAGTIVHSFLLTFSGILSVSAAIIALYYFSIPILVGVLSFLGGAGIFVAVCMMVMLRLNAKSIVISRTANTLFVESLNSLRSIRALSCETYVKNTFNQKMIEYTKILFDVDASRASIKSIPGLIALLMGVTYFSISSEGISITGEFLFAAVVIVMRIFLSVGNTMTSFSIFAADVRAINDLSDFISTESEKKIKLNEFSVNDQFIKDGVDFVDVSYGYMESRKVIESFTYHFDFGRVYAIVGPSGSGKSTIADLLMGMLNPDNGVILYNGKRVSIQELRKSVILVEQQPKIFSASIRENIALGMNSNDSSIMSVLEDVGMSSYIRGLSNGMDTTLEYQGANLSGGQKQRLAIARALLRNPQVLILDEATSALDAEMRKFIVDRVRNKYKNKILIFITHDESVASVADSIINMK